MLYYGNNRRGQILICPASQSSLVTTPVSSSMYITYISFFFRVLDKTFFLKLTPAVPSVVSLLPDPRKWPCLSFISSTASLSQTSEMSPMTKLYLIPFRYPNLLPQKTEGLATCYPGIITRLQLYDRTRTASGLYIVQDHSGLSKELLGLLSGIRAITHLGKCLP